MKKEEIIIDKPFKSYQEQIEIIANKNIKVEDKSFAESALSNYSFYTMINGYKNSILYDKRNNKFIDQTTFEMLYDIRRIDSSLNNLLFKYILIIEKSLKSKLAYLIAYKYGEACDFYYSKNSENDYLNDQHYSSTSKGYNRTNILNQLREYTTSKMQKKSASNYYKWKKGYIPPWIFVNDIPFGMTIKWYQILKDQDKTDVANTIIQNDALTIEEKKHLLNKAFELLREFRNAIAHGNKTFAYLPDTKLPISILQKVVPRHVLSKKEMQKQGGTNGLFSICTLIILLIDDNIIISDFITELGFMLTKYETLEFPKDITIYEIFKVPKNIMKRLSLLQQTKVDTENVS